MTSTRTEESAVNGPYKRASNVVIAIRPPTVILPEIDKWPPTP